NATQMWSLGAYLDALDAGTGMGVMRELVDVAASRGRVARCGTSMTSVTSEPEPLSGASDGARTGMVSLRGKGSRPASPSPSMGPPRGGGLGKARSGMCALSEDDVLEELMRALGVTRSAAGIVALDDGAPLSPLRRTLCRRA